MMTKKQTEQFNRMRSALIRISKGYQTPDKLRKDSEKDWGVGFVEALEMAYENIQTEAKRAVKGVKEFSLKSLKEKPAISEPTPPTEK